MKCQEGQESARNNWLTSLMNLAGLKPDFVKGTGGNTQSTVYGAGSMIGDIGSGIGSIFKQYQISKMLEEANENNKNSLLSQLYGSGALPTTTQSSLFNSLMGNNKSILLRDIENLPFLLQ